MTFPKGKSGNQNGRPKGAAGKANQDIKATFQLLIERNLSKMDKWLNDLAEDNPGAALNYIMKMSEFLIPKIKSMEVVEPVIPEKSNKCLFQSKSIPVVHSKSIPFLINKKAVLL